MSYPRLLARQIGLLARRGASALQGFITVMAFTESGWMRRFRLSKRVLTLASLLLALLLAASAVSLAMVFRDQVSGARLSYLERENRSLTSLIETQAEQLSRLKREVARLREFERGLRAASGMDAPGEAMLAGQGEGPANLRSSRP